LRFCTLERLLKEKYRIKPEEAKQLSSFLLPMLAWHPHERASARKMLEHPWLSMPSDYNYQLDELDFRKMMLRQSIKTDPEDEGEKFKRTAFKDKRWENLGDGNLSDLYDSEVSS
jgi:serine/threonine protein kinase